MEKKTKVPLTGETISHNVTGIPPKVDNKNMTANIFWENSGQIHPKFEEKHQYTDQEAQQSLRKIHMKKIIPTQILLKLLEIKNEHQILQTVWANRSITIGDNDMHGNWLLFKNSRCQK